MKLSEIVQHVQIDDRKFTEYALNEDHPKGRHKARRFRESLGFTVENFSDLKKQIEEKILGGGICCWRERQTWTALHRGYFD